MARAVLALAALLALAGCGSEGDKITQAGDPCVFMLEFAARCTPAGKTAICSQRRPVLARSMSQECSR